MRRAARGVCTCPETRAMSTRHGDRFMAPAPAGYEAWRQKGPEETWTPALAVYFDTTCLPQTDMKMGFIHRYSVLSRSVR
jgi:hypothetical protein